MFFNDINHGYRAAILKKNLLRLLRFYMGVATSCCYGKVLRTMRTTIVSYLLKYFANINVCTITFTMHRLSSVVALKAYTVSLDL